MFGSKGVALLVCLNGLRTGFKSLNEALVADKLINALGLLKLFWI
jgi:hypothetical protein